MGKSMLGEDLVSSVGCFPVRGELLFLSWGNPCPGRILCSLWGVSLSEVSYYSCHGEIHVGGGSCVVFGVFPCQRWVTIPVTGKSMSGEDLVPSVGCFPVRGELLFLSLGNPCLGRISCRLWGVSLSRGELLFLSLGNPCRGRISCHLWGGFPVRGELLFLSLGNPCYVRCLLFKQRMMENLC